MKGGDPELVDRLLTMLEQERALNILLTQALLPQQTVTISGAPKSTGPVPWATLKAKLESRFRRVVDGQESVSDADEQHDAGGDHGEHIGDASRPEVPSEETQEVQQPAREEQ